MFLICMSTTAQAFKFGRLQFEYILCSRSLDCSAVGENSDFFAASYPDYCNFHVFGGLHHGKLLWGVGLLPSKWYGTKALASELRCPLHIPKMSACPKLSLANPVLPAHSQLNNRQINLSPSLRLHYHPSYPAFVEYLNPPSRSFSYISLLHTSTPRMVNQLSTTNVLGHGTS